MQKWVEDAIEPLSEEAEGFALGRGLPSTLLAELGIGLWRPPAVASPDSSYAARYGDKGEGVADWLAIPLYAPQGRLVGVTYRRWEGPKEVLKFRLKGSAKVPIFEGLNPASLGRLWRGGDVWLVEGIFDLSLSHVIPTSDCILACGTARLTNPQTLFLQRFLGRGRVVHVVFDEDAIGREKGGEAVKRLDRVGVRARHVRYRGGKDPGEIWERGGKSALAMSFNL